MDTLQSFDPLLEHLIDVESEMIELSAKAHRTIIGWIGESGLQPGDEVLEALQYQDILAQQLGATIEAIKSIQEILAQKREEPVSALRVAQADAKLTDVLEKARQKRVAFSGKSGSDDEAIEFF